MASNTRDQSLPARVVAATSYQLLPGAHNTSGTGTQRAGRWPIIAKYDGHPDAVALATREAGVFLKRQLAKLERDGQLELLGPDESAPTPAVTTEEAETPRLRLLSEDEESRYPEGVASYRLHRQLERDTGLAEKAKQKRLAEAGSLSCDVCGFDFEQEYGELGAGYIEAHHTVPVSQLNGDTQTQLSDLALVCSNCHRMLHRGPKLMSIKELRILAGTTNEPTDAREAAIACGIVVGSVEPLV